jgi:glucokinase
VNLSLVADIGGTHARFAIFDGQQLVDPIRVRTRDFEQPVDAVHHYLDEVRGRDRQGLPTQAVFAVACPVQGDQIEMTNSPWRFSVENTRQRLGLQELLFINDFAALSLSLPGLTSQDCSSIRPGTADPRAAKALIGPGTGLGVGGLVPTSSGGWSPLEGEGGHCDLSVTNAREWAVFQLFQHRWSHVSAERVLSGPGLAELYSALLALDGKAQAPGADAPQIVARALTGEDPAARETVQLFSAWLGAVAGDLALVLGARGGVFLGGGMLERMGDAFAADLFIDRFLAKGRMSQLLAPIPVDLVVNPWAPLWGASKLLAGAASSP